MKHRNVILLILAISLHFSFQAQENPASPQKISIEDAVVKAWDYMPGRLSQLQWIPNLEAYSYVEENVLIKKGLDEQVDSLFQLSDFPESLGMTRFPRISWLDEQTFQFQTRTAFYQSNISDKSTVELLTIKEEAENQDRHKATNQMAYTQGSDLYIQLKDSTIQITHNAPGIVSGQSIARNEFGIMGGTFWSPSGDRLAFYEKDENQVSNYTLIDYSTTPATPYTVKYPMAGSKSEKAAVGVYNLASGKTVYLNMNEGIRNDGFYATNLSWHPNGNELWLAKLNRDQNHYSLERYDANSGAFLGILLEESDDKYTEPEHPAIILQSGQFLWLSEKDGYNQLYRYNDKGKLLTQSDQAFPIIEFLGMNPEESHAFVIATGENPTEQHLYSVNLKNMKMRQLTQTNGVHNISMSPGAAYFIDEWSSLEVAGIIEVLDAKGNVRQEVFKAEDPMSAIVHGSTEIFSMPSFDGTTLWCRMIKPSDFDQSKKYPVIVYVYGGPHAQMVRNTWMGQAPLWMTAMAEEGYIIFTVDNRGSANRGKAFEQAIFRNLGEIEMKDQLHCTQWLKDQPYTDADRFAIHGWSYGGFMTSSLMTKAAGTYKVGVAGGPVTDWRFYEVMYGERYMDRPEENPEGYVQADLKNHINKLEGDLLLIHGSIDDVVLPQHSMTLLKKAIDEGIEIDFFTYPGHAHNVMGKDRAHLMRKVFDYIDLHLSRATPKSPN